MNIFLLSHIQQHLHYHHYVPGVQYAHPAAYAFTPRLIVVSAQYEGDYVEPDFATDPEYITAWQASMET